MRHDCQVIKTILVVVCHRKTLVMCRPEPCPVPRYGIDSRIRGEEKVTGFQPTLE